MRWVVPWLSTSCWNLGWGASGAPPVVEAGSPKLPAHDWRLHPISKKASDWLLVHLCIYEFVCSIRLTVGPFEFSARLTAWAAAVPSETAELTRPGVALLAATGFCAEVEPPVELFVLVRPLTLALALSTERRCVRSFSSRRHFARRFENQT